MQNKFSDNIVDPLKKCTELLLLNFLWLNWFVANYGKCIAVQMVQKHCFVQTRLSVEFELAISGFMGVLKHLFHLNLNETW